MKVFLSWSGETSRMLAEALRDWLPAVLQAVEPWMSAEDIDKGARWSSDIGKQLEQAKIGIICLTKDNQHAPWIQFEAGALSKTLDNSFVIPYLLNIKPADVKGPLVQFQSAIADEADTLRLIRSVNKAMGDQALPEVNIEKYFAKWWPELANALARIPAAEPKARSTRTDRDILEELLVLMRGITRGQSGPIIERYETALGRRIRGVRRLPQGEILVQGPSTRGDEIRLVRLSDGAFEERWVRAAPPTDVQKPSSSNAQHATARAGSSDPEAPETTQINVAPTNVEKSPKKQK